MALKYPQYRIGQWIDTSDEAMSKPQATILYGVQIKPEKGAKWLHCRDGNEPMIFDTPEKASSAMVALKSGGDTRREQFQEWLKSKPDAARLDIADAMFSAWCGAVEAAARRLEEEARYSCPCYDNEIQTFKNAAMLREWAGLPPRHIDELAEGGL